MKGIAGLVTVVALLLGLYGILDWAIGFAIAAGVLWLIDIIHDSYGFP